jgi:hypothetical protein
MALMVETTHLSPTRPADDTSGILFEPAWDPADATATGGWAGRTRTAGRLVLAGALAATGAAVAAGRIRRRSA